MSLRYISPLTSLLNFEINSISDLCLAMKPRGGLRWMDGTLDDGKLLWVNPAGFVTLSDWSGSCAFFDSFFASPHHRDLVRMFHAKSIRF